LVESQFESLLESSVAEIDYPVFLLGLLAATVFLHYSGHWLTMIDLGKKSLLGVQIDAVDYDAAVGRLIQAACQSKSYTTTALAVHGVMTGALDSQHRYRLNQFDMIVPDGMPVRWGLHLLHGCALPDRVYGPTFMLKLCEAASQEGLPVFFFGTNSQTLEKLTANLTRQFPSLKVAGSEPSQFRQLTQPESEALAGRIRASGARILFAGLGCPRQEVFAFEMASVLNMPLIAVGAAFPFHAGSLPQAPIWMQKSGLEWLFRLASEPKRLWRRYLYLNPAYLFLLALQLTRLRRFDTSNDVPPSTPMRIG
jgi:exopolysaccharide biosynthesis WecB/TagA/CpsF family protein